MLTALMPTPSTSALGIVGAESTSSVALGSVANWPGCVFAVVTCVYLVAMIVADVISATTRAPLVR